MCHLQGLTNLENWVEHNFDIKLISCIHNDLTVCFIGVSRYVLQL